MSPRLDHRWDLTGSSRPSWASRPRPGGRRGAVISHVIPSPRPARPSSCSTSAARRRCRWSWTSGGRMILACQENHLPGDGLGRSGSRTGRPGSTPSSCSAARRLRGPAARAAGGPRRRRRLPERLREHGPPFIGDFDADVRSAAIAGSRCCCRRSPRSAAVGAVTPASYGMFSADLPPYRPPRPPRTIGQVLLEALDELGEPRRGRGGRAVPRAAEPLRGPHAEPRRAGGRAVRGGRRPGAAGDGRHLPHEHRGGRPGRGVSGRGAELGHVQHRLEPLRAGRRPPRLAGARSATLDRHRDQGMSRRAPAARRAHRRPAPGGEHASAAGWDWTARRPSVDGPAAGGCGSWPWRPWTPTGRRPHRPVRAPSIRTSGAGTRRSSPSAWPAAPRNGPGASCGTLFAAQWRDGRVPHIVFNPRVPVALTPPGPQFWVRSPGGPPQAPPRASCSRRCTRSPPGTVYRRDPRRRRAAGSAGSTRSWSPPQHYLRHDRDARRRRAGLPGAPAGGGPGQQPRLGRAAGRRAGRPELMRRHRRHDTRVAAAEQRPTDVYYARYIVLVDSTGQRRHLDAGWPPTTRSSWSARCSTRVTAAAEHALADIAEVVGAETLAAHREAGARLDRGALGRTSLRIRAAAPSTSVDLRTDVLLPSRTVLGLGRCCCPACPQARSRRRGRGPDLRPVRGGRGDVAAVAELPPQRRGLRPGAPPAWPELDQHRLAGPGRAAAPRAPGTRGGPGRVDDRSGGSRRGCH